MSTSLRKLILGVLSFVILVIITVVVYAFINAKNNNTTISQGIISIFPRTIDTTTTIENNGGEDTIISTTTPNSQLTSDRLFNISSEPTSGGFFSSTSTIRYIEKATGNVYEYSFYNRNSRKISNTSIPQIFDTYWLNKDTFIARYLDKDNTTINSVIAYIINPGDSGILNTTFLPNNIKSVSIFNTTAFYITEDYTGTKGYLFDAKNNKTNVVFESSLKEIGGVIDGKKLYVYTYPSFNITGSLFEVRDGKFYSVLGTIKGLDVNKHIFNGSLVISSFSTLNNNSYTLNMKSGLITNINNVLIPEKCIYITDTLYCALDTIPYNFPDSWYSGLVNFNDVLYKIGQNGEKIEEYNFKDAIPEGIDVINLSVSPDNKTLLFMNKKDNSLWSLDIY